MSITLSQKACCMVQAPYNDSCQCQPIASAPELVQRSEYMVTNNTVRRADYTVWRAGFHLARQTVTVFAATNVCQRHAAELWMFVTRACRVIKDVLDKVRGKHYQLACGLAYEGITGAQQETGINKPSEYYAASIELEKQRAAAAAGGGADGSGAAQAPPQQQQQQGPPSTPLAAGNGAAAAMQI